MTPTIDSMTPAMAYLRVSGPDQVDKDGYQRQEAAISTYATLHGYSLIHIYREQVSGTKESLDRPVWLEMMAAILLNGVKTIIIERVDRLARDLMVQEHIIADIQSRQITLISTCEPDLCSEDPTRVLMRQIMGAIAKYDKTMMRLKTTAAMKRIKASTGRCEGAKPFGHYDGEGEVLTEMHRLRAEGMTYERIVDTLNQWELKPRGQGRWFYASVYRTLRRGVGGAPHATPEATPEDV